MVTLGIDVGATKTAVGLFEQNRLLQSGVATTGDFESTMSAIAALVADWRLGESVQSVGFACPGPLDIERGTVLNDSTMRGWLGMCVTDKIRSLFGVPAILINDADAALLGEVFEGGNGVTATAAAVMLTFGTGVGGAVWTGEFVYRGAYGEHPEIGHIGVDPRGPLCYCGLRGCLESIAGGPAIDRGARDLGIGGIENLASEIEAGNKGAIDLANRTNAAISNALVTLTHTVRPASFILGGGVMEKLSHYMSPASVPVNSSTVPGPIPRIYLAALGNQAGMYGASVAARGSGKKASL